MTFTQVIKRWVPSALRGPIRYYGLRASALVQLLRERRIPLKPGDIPIPPPLLRYRVHGSLDPDSFLNVGRNCALDLENSLRLIGKDWHVFNNVLDFGCGCGRVLRHFCDLPEKCQLYGTDVDREAIEWCRSKLRRVNVAINDPLPPLPFAAGTFDLVYALSVFTHLNEDYQFAWLSELKRVAKPGGTLILTTQGAYAQKVALHEGHLFPTELEALQHAGFFFKTFKKGRFKLDSLPDFYQIAFHTRQYVTEVWTRFFRLQHYAERGLNGHQDLALLCNE